MLLCFSGRISLVRTRRGKHYIPRDINVMIRMRGYMIASRRNIKLGTLYTHERYLGINHATINEETATDISSISLLMIYTATNVNGQFARLCLGSLNGDTNYICIFNISRFKLKHFHSWFYANKRENPIIEEVFYIRYIIISKNVIMM